MFPFSLRNKMSDAPDLPTTPPPTTPVHPLDALTGGAFSAATSGERASRIRDWLASQPTPAQLQDVFKELSGRDKGAARAVRERLDELRRAKNQEAIAADWADKANALLAAPKLNIADAMAWQRDAAKAGAPLSREPLAELKTQLTERIKVIEDLQHRVQVQREAAVLLVAAVIVMMGRVPLGEYMLPISGDLSSWILNVLNASVRRAILIGVSLGAVALSFKIIFGVERSYLGGGKE